MIKTRRRGWLSRLWGGSEGTPEAPVLPTKAPSPGQSVNALDLLFDVEGRAALEAHGVGSARSASDGWPLSTAPPPGTDRYVPPSATLVRPPLEAAIDKTPLKRLVTIAEAPLVQLRITVHIAARGDMKAGLDGWAGERGSRLELQGIAVTPTEGIDPDDLEYQALLDDDTLTGWHRDGSFCGTRGEHRPLRGVALRLVGPAATTHQVSYTAVSIDGAEIGPMANGALCAASDASALEAINIVVYPQEKKCNPLQLGHGCPQDFSEPDD